MIHIRLFAMDVDGTMTDGRFTVDMQGNETKTFNVRDGMAIKLLKRAGIKTAIISGRRSLIVENRAKSLGVDYCCFSDDKVKIIQDICNQNGFLASEVAYIGDDLNDLDAMRLVGLAACPSDACREVIEISHYVCCTKGGFGAIREFANRILSSAF